MLLNISVFYVIDSANRKLPSDMMFMVLNDRKIHPDAFQINIILFHEMSTFWKSHKSNKLFHLAICKRLCGIFIASLWHSSTFSIKFKKKYQEWSTEILIIFVFDIDWTYWSILYFFHSVIMNIHQTVYKFGTTSASLLKYMFKLVCFTFHLRVL